MVNSVHCYTATACLAAHFSSDVDNVESLLQNLEFEVTTAWRTIADDELICVDDSVCVMATTDRGVSPVVSVIYRLAS